MTLWIIEPRDPLIARDGRPFNATPGVRARSLPFPYPSTTAGGLRTRAGQNGHGRFDPALIDQVLKISVRGPLLAEAGAGHKLRLLAPAPADALLFDEPGGQCARKRLLPLPLLAGVESDLPPELQQLAGLPQADERKPARDAPHFWYWPAFEQWLLAPANDRPDPRALGVPGLGLDQRSHVAIDPQTLTGLEGMLFMTSGLSFWQNRRPENGKLSHVQRLVLVIEAGDYAADLAQAGGYGALGGERRLMYWRRAAAEHSSPFAKPPDALVEEIVRAGQCRLILLTPALFNKGWLPDLDGWAKHGVKPRLTAAMVDKPAVISGWDLAIKAAKPTRRLVPAGAVYYLQLQGDAAGIRAWVTETWFSNVSDKTANRAAGFGLAALGVA